MIQHEFKPVETITYEESRTIITCDCCGKIIYDSNLNEEYKDKIKGKPIKDIKYFQLTYEKDSTFTSIHEENTPEIYCSSDCLSKVFISKTSNALIGIFRPTWYVEVKSQQII